MPGPGRPLRIIEFLGLRRTIVGALTITVLLGMGERMGERFLPLYLVALGGGALSVGLLNGLQNLLSALYSYPGGYLAHRLGPKRALLVFNAVAILGYLIVIAIPRWEAVIAGAVFFIAWSAVSLPSVMDLVVRALPAGKRTMGVSMHSFVRRVPMALGPVLGGLFITAWGVQTGMRVAFAGALVLAVAAAFLQQALIQVSAPAAGRAAVGNPIRLFAEMASPLRRLLVADILVRFCEQIPYAFVVIWAVETISRPVTPLEFGILTAIEMVTAMLIYVPVAYLADRTNKKPFVVATFAFFTAFPLLLLFSHSFWPLVAAFVVRGLKEFGEPTRKALILDLAPEDRTAGMFGLYYLMRDTIVSIGAFGGAALWSIRPEVNFLAAFAFGLAGTVWFAAFGSDLGQPAARTRSA